LFVYPEKVITYTGEPGTPLDGIEVQLKQLRLGADIEALVSATYLIDLHAVVAPFVVGWNVGGKQIVDVEVPAVLGADGTEIVPARTRKETEYVQLPPPAEAGPDILLAISPEIRDWIVGRLYATVGHRDTDPKASSPTSGPSPNGEPDAMPSAPSTSSRRARSSSAKPLPAT
jgi:hypothetical protein